MSVIIHNSRPDTNSVMNLLYYLYSFGGTSLLPFIAPLVLKKKYRDGIRERLGFIPVGGIKPHKKRIWIHGASLGELNAISSIYKEIKNMIPGCNIFISITTPHGKRRAVELFKNSHCVFYPPIDVPFAVRNALNKIRPHGVIFIETEIWPVWITEAKRIGSKVFLLNGRISPRSINRYMKIRTFLKNVLSKMDAMSMISTDDAERIISLGADPKRVFVNGNAKYDMSNFHINPSVEKRLRDLLSIEPSTPVLVAGSTRRGEEEALLGAFEAIKKEFPDSIIIIAPRHITRVRDIIKIIKKMGFNDFQRFSHIKSGKERRSSSIVLVDTFGDLFNLYSVAWVVFCGGSLVPLGGQNPVEPSVWGKPVLYGPSMDDFRDAKELLEAQGIGFEVNGEDMFSTQVIKIFKDHRIRKKVKERANKCFLKNSTSGRRHARVILERLNDIYNLFPNTK